MSIGRAALLFVAVVGFSGAALAQDEEASASDEPLGFLQCPAKFQPVPGDPGATAWHVNDLNLSKYDAVFVDQPVVFIASDSKYKGIQPDQIKGLADLVQSELVKALGDDVSEADQTGKGVLAFRVALTNVYLKKHRRLLSFTPIGLVVHAAIKNDPVNNLYKKVSLEHAVLKIEGVDTESVSCVGAAIVQVMGDGDRSGAESWDALNNDITTLATRFAKAWTKSRTGQQ